MRRLLLPVLALVALPLGAQSASPLSRELDALITQVNPKVIAWRRDIHEHPELSGEEVRTAGLVAAHLRSLGLEVREQVGGHGVVGILRGGRPGRVVALRADMDALPVTELVDLPFKSTVRATYLGQDVGVMHACGHDNHVAILMGAAEALTKMKARIPGTIVFIFQPAEESLPDGTGGAEKMLADGAFDSPKVDAVFGLHVWPGPAGSVMYRPGPTMASASSWYMTVHGRQTHGSRPWGGIDPVVVSSQIVSGLQTIISRQTDITEVPAIVTVATIHGGVRNNIIPDSVVMSGTIRTFQPAQRDSVFRRIERTVQHIAAASGARATVRIDSGYPVTMNDSALTAQMLPTLQRVAGVDNVGINPLVTGAEDFSYFQRRAPGLFVFLGVTPRDQNWQTAASNHSPLFFADESALPVGVKLLSALALDYLSAPASATRR